MAATHHAELFRHFPTLHRTAQDVVTADDIRGRLASDRPLRIKYGVDVTASFLHLGHAVNLWAMRELQEAGHRVVFLVGDFTTTIGDPTGRSTTRPRISRDRIERDAQDYVAQVGQVLLTDPDVFEVRYNSEWWSTMRLERFLELLSLVTHARLVRREMFQRRIEDEAEIYAHELVYPVLQGYDSYAMDSDLTIVGTDQLFNELMGRFYQERLGVRSQVVITTRITPGIDGRDKQSKSRGNYIALSDPPREKFGKAMRLPDDLVVEFLQVYTLVPLPEIAVMRRAMAAGELNPMDAKRVLGRALVERYHGTVAAAAADDWFTNVFSRRGTPDEAPVVAIESPDATLLDVLKVCLPAESSSALRRLVEQGGVRVGDRKLTDVDLRGGVADGDVVRVGRRRWFRVEYQAR